MTAGQLADEIEAVGMEACESRRDEVVAALRRLVALEDARRKAIDGTNDRMLDELIDRLRARGYV